MAYDAPLRAVLDKFGPTELSRQLGLRWPSVVTQWDRVPAKWVGRVSALTGFSPEFLRPDLFPTDDAREDAA